MLDLILEMASEQGTHRAVIGMAHRGRLNVLAHIVGVSYESILSEFEASRVDEEVLPEDSQADDVKYHLGASGRFEAKAGVVDVSVMPNPSHLEAVDPVVEGRARAEQTDRSKPVASLDTRITIPILIHGDAAFAAQGVVAETFNLNRLAGYANGGTVHLIVNNQVGFTASPAEQRSTPYCTDVAKMLECPIWHVNGEDLDGLAQVIDIACEYRAQFGSDVVIDSSGHTCYDWRENGIESLINFPQAVRGADDCTVDPDGCKRHTRRASNEVPEHEKVQPGNEGVNQLINADWGSIRD